MLPAAAHLLRRGGAGADLSLHGEDLCMSGMVHGALLAVYEGTHMQPCVQKLFA